MKKKVLTICILVAILSCFFVVVSSAYDIGNIFLTRDEWDNFESSLGDNLDNLEMNRQSSIRDEVGYQMYRRDIIDASVMQSMQAESSGLATIQSWSIRRENENGGIAPTTA